MIMKLIAVVLATLGALSMHSGIAAREALEPGGFVAGAGFIPGTGSEPGTLPGEVRSSLIAAAAPAVALACGARRSLGVGLLAAALGLAWASSFGSRPRGGRHGGGSQGAEGVMRLPWLPTLLLIPGAYALYRLGVDASAAAASAAEARAGFGLWAPAVGLTLLLLSSRRKVPAPQR